MEIHTKTLPALVALGLAFLAGWSLSKWRHTVEVERLRDERDEAVRLVDASADMAHKSLEQAIKQQVTLNICLERLGFKPQVSGVKP